MSTTKGNSVRIQGCNPYVLWRYRGEKRDITGFNLYLYSRVEYFKEMCMLNNKNIR
jgi:hypothetical protein